MKDTIINEKRVPTICLNMIVKNESKIITRLFNSVLPILDTYCICDTGSTDNTIKIISDYFEERNIKGKIIQHDFVNFEVNRNIALKGAKDMADYILFLDADMKLQIDPSFNKSQLTELVYNIQQGNTMAYYNTRIISNKIEAEYCGVTHEYIKCKNCNHTKLYTLKINDLGDGGCKQNKFKRDIDLLSKEVEKNPTHIRSNFYLANSYFDTQDFKNALIYYKKHAEIVTWNEEKFYNYYRQGLCYKSLNETENMVIYFVKAWYTRPCRVESLFELIQYYRCKSQWEFCKLYYEIAKKIEYPKNDILFVHKDIYNYKLLYEYIIFGYYIGENKLHKEMTTLMNIPYKFNLNNLINNYKFYYPLLSYQQNIKITDTFTREINGETYTFKSSTPSIIKFKDKYIMNLCWVNYTITLNGTHNCIKNIITINKYIEMDDKFKIVKNKELDMIFKDREHEGIADIKLISYHSKIYFTGTAYKKNDTIGIVGGRYNCKDLLEFNEYSIDGEQVCEKNWVYIPDTKRMIYKWYPLQIGKLYNNKLTGISESPMPNIFQLARSSTNGCKYNDEIWFIVHLLHRLENEPQFYYHMFVKFDATMKFLEHSVPVKFSKESIEYCSGLIVEEDRIIISHSIWDKESYIKYYNKKYIDSFFQV